MPFSQATITSVVAIPDRADLLVRWTSTSPPGTTYQVYLGRRLAWFGSPLSCILPAPTTAGAHGVAIDVGTVGSGEGPTDFSADLPAPGWNDRALLTWQGGYWESPTLVGFRVYSGDAPGAAVDYTTPVGSVAAYPQGIAFDGWGVGGYGTGGWGSTGSSYSWESDPLASGVWNLGVRPYDRAGNEGDAREVAITIVAPPLPPARNPAGLRLIVQGYNATTRVATLAWSPSPG